MSNFLDEAAPPGIFESRTGKDPASVFGEELGLTSPGDLTRGISGLTAAEAQIEAARIQEQLGREALEEQVASQAALEETLAPFVGFGEQIIPGFQNLFQPDVASSISASPTVSQFLDIGLDRAAGNPLLSTVDPSSSDRAALLAGIDLIGRERGDLLSAIQLGQASAAQQAAGNLQTGASRADLLSQIGNVQAAGGIGAAQSRAQGAQNIIGGLSALAGAFS